ncbi:hypothetical protein CSQ91_08330 [Janthinobacterium sp. BJB301]|nr:hypothetical protein CSQ91_08330 [Janthinobacterium sp. BJB301]
MRMIAFKHGSAITEIGFENAFYSLFSTVAVHLEDGRWGSRFPHIMEKLYQGRLDAADAPAACLQMQAIKRGLAALAPTEVVWDMHDRAKEPPWGSAIGPNVTSMANYHATTAGRNLFDEMAGCVAALAVLGGMLEIIPFDGIPPFYYPD